MSSDVDQFLSGYEPAIRDLAMQMRELILSVMPDAHERVYTGWKIINYSLAGGMRDQVCSIGPHKTRVNLYFTRGADLDDPSGLLEGTGKKMRHVKIEYVNETRVESLRALIAAAVALRRAQFSPAPAA